jgi:hypothetical protein
MNDSHHSSLVEQALFEHTFHALVLTLHENERPLRGLSGRMDWIFHGEISRFLKHGVIQGTPGEYSLLPIRKNEQTYFLLLMGLGKSSKPGLREKPSLAMLRELNTRLSSLQIKKIGISRSDFGDISTDLLTQHLSGAELWIGQ